MSTKTCSTCRITKQITEFGKKSAAKDKLQSQCKPCRSSYLAEYRSRPGYQEKQAAYMVNWVARNQNQLRSYRDANKEHRAAITAAWKRAHPEAVCDYERRRRARKRGNGTGAKYTRREIADRDDWVCGLCHLAISPDATVLRDTLTVDHIIPLNCGGTDHPDNLQAAHYGCNAAKSDHFVS